MFYQMKYLSLNKHVLRQMWNLDLPYELALCMLVIAWEWNEEFVKAFRVWCIVYWYRKHLYTAVWFLNSSLYILHVSLVKRVTRRYNSQGRKDHSFFCVEYNGILSHVNGCCRLFLDTHWFVSFCLTCVAWNNT